MRLLKWQLCLVLVMVLYTWTPYLLTKAEAAADPSGKSANLTIALVDSGIDYQHPDLKPYIVDGINLLNPGTLPQDDNGHGTNVAGIIISMMQKNANLAGVNEKPQIMPVKALEADGIGDEFHLGEGIRYAVAHGAKIVVLSLGLNKYTSYLSGIIQEAEDQGVLMVAATGNGGDAVKYPAAYPTVLAVGGVTADNQVDAQSNFGSEVDVVAPFKVYTTIWGGGYDNREGTSMAAPQVAAICALLWEKYPQMSPSQIRNQIRQTARDIGPPGWDEYSGYGLLQADAALKDKPLDDIYESNDRPEQAKSLPIGKTSYGSLASSEDVDWFAVDAPYDGSFQIQLISQTSQQTDIEMTHYQDLTQSGKIFKQGLAKGISVQVTKGRHYIKLRPSNPLIKDKLLYQILVQFVIAPDPFEDNDSKYKAYVLPARSQTITGNFHQNSDQDWFMMTITQAGTLLLKLSTDTARIDSVLQIEKKGEKTLIIDQKTDGQTETTLPIEVTPGDYYFLVSNVKDYIFPISGEYTLQIEYTTRYLDPNEPNDRSFQATSMKLGSMYNGVLNENTDVDWFSFKIEDESLVHVNLTNIPQFRTMSFILYDYTLKKLQAQENSIDQAKLFFDVKLSPGTYYIKLTVDQSFQNQLYNLEWNASPIVAGFADISGHWAEASIKTLVGQNLIHGYGNYRFAPDQAISRAEAVTVLNNIFNWTSTEIIQYPDVSTADWFYSAIAKAAHAGAVTGYPDGYFQPEMPISRMEMAAMIVHAWKLKTNQVEDPPFNDIAVNYWGAPVLQKLKAKGWISGFSDGSFQPERQATRADFVQFLNKIINS